MIGSVPTGGGLPFKRRARCAGEPKPPIADTGATQDIASYRSIKNQCDLIDFLRITHHGSLKNVKSRRGRRPLSRAEARLRFASLTVTRSPPMDQRPLDNKFKLTAAFARKRSTTQKQR